MTSSRKLEQMAEVAWKVAASRLLASYVPLYWQYVVAAPIDHKNDVNNLPDLDNSGCGNVVNGSPNFSAHDRPRLIELLSSPEREHLQSAARSRHRAWRCATTWYWKSLKSSRQVALHP